MDVIIGEQNNNIFNTGVMIVRNTEWSRYFFKSMLQDPRCSKTRESKKCCWEQDCFGIIFRTDDLSRRLASIPSEVFNCQALHKNYNNKCEPWVYHVMAGNEAIKTSRLDKAIEGM